MNEKLCFGVIPLKQESDWKVLIVRHLSGNYWGFPKGHANLNELPLDVAKRELFEETGLFCEQFLGQAFTESYAIKHLERGIQKTVTYYPAIVTGQLILDSSEIQEAFWGSFQEILEKITFEGSRKIAEALQCQLKKPV